ncbi:MAG: HupE/UreJ family protein [Candidatus Saccharibacteria bacterium]|nr:HupE/UreJ family protein [Moraxellaceae bacterium]
MQKSFFALIKNVVALTLTVLFWFVLLNLFNSAQAHQFSTAYLAIETQTQNKTPKITAEYRLAVRDLSLLVPLEIDQNRQITWGAIKAQQGAIATLLSQDLQWKSGTSACTMNPQREPLALDKIAGLSYLVMYLAVDCGDQNATALDYRVLQHVDSGHRLILSVHDANQLKSATRTWLIAPSITSLDASESASNGLIQTFKTYVKEGTHHILSGYDHLLFLLCLLLPAVYIRKDKQWIPVQSSMTAIRHTFYIATAFTLAHSITLTLAALNVISLPSKLVESVIAFSIALAALSNLFPIFGTKQIRVAFIFGLIHGFGFASALTDLPLTTGTRMMALFSFNFGIELGQITCILIFFPIALALRERVFYRQVMFRGGSVVACVLALLWMTQRIFDLNWIPG